MTRPIGAACTSASPATLTLQADTVFDTLPAQIAHASTGLHIDAELVPAATTTSLPAPPPTHPPIINLDSHSSGTTINATVGSAFFITDLIPGVAWPGASTVVSSDPGVVGRLVDPTSSEYRAWAPGQATLSIPKQPCPYTTPPCTSSWVVHIHVT